MRKPFSLFILLLINLGFVQTVAQTSDLEVVDNSLIYRYDEKGNRILDFSYCGYKNSGQPIPTIENVIFVSHKEGDSSDRIQRAIDYVSSLPIRKDGFRGAVLLDEGEFTLSRELIIAASGVVLRGKDKEKSILLRKGVDRGAIIKMEGENDRKMVQSFKVSSPYVPVNATSLEIAEDYTFQPGDRVLIRRPSTQEWIHLIGCDAFGGGVGSLGWKPGDANITWDRTIVAQEGNKIIFDVPLTVALDAAYGEAEVFLYKWSGRVENLGVENLTLVSDYNKEYPKDEDHCWTGISIDYAENCWIRQVDFKHLAGSAVIVQPLAAKITVEECTSTFPVSEIGGMRRTTFYTLGQNTLFQRCYSEQGINDFAVGYCAPGPNAFVQCESYESLGFSGAINSWAPGVLFDIVNIDGHNLTFKNLGQEKNGAGWNTGNSMFWQCTAAEIECFSPTDDAINRAYGCWAQFSGNGEWVNSNNHIFPRSLFYGQLAERLKKDVSEQARLLPISVNATSSPTIEEAELMTQEAYIPRMTLEQWIDKSSLEIPVTARLLDVDDIKTGKSKLIKTNFTPVNRVELVDGRLQMNGSLLTGFKMDVQWWNGKLRADAVKKSRLHVTRFVPGRVGVGYTDRIDSVVEIMTRSHALALDHNYGLWYDRRRDDHERVRRRDGDVWGPFYEQPFARSGEGTAWDGLSKYDLTRPNEWYWYRLKAFADQAEREGKLLYHQNYFQHNILEAGAHWVDSPWRSVNNINNTDFPEPVPFAGDKRIFIAEMFYDINHPVRRELHRKYIRQCLDNFADNSNVVQLISEEFTGPLHFVEFWIDEIAAWEKETGKNALVALSTTKDVQDAILNDPVRSAVVDIIDIRYWHYKDDGTVYAPPGGVNMAPRQHARKMKVGRVNFMEVYKAVSEYRIAYPDKAVMYNGQNSQDTGWASFMAGGSCVDIPFVDDKGFVNAALAMTPVQTDTNDYQKLVKSDNGCIIYSHSSQNVPLELAVGRYTIKYIDPKSGETNIISNNLRVNNSGKITVSLEKAGVYWIQKR